MGVGAYSGEYGIYSSPVKLFQVTYALLALMSMYGSTGVCRERLLPVSSQLRQLSKVLLHVSLSASGNLPCHFSTPVKTAVDMLYTCIGSKRLRSKVKFRYCLNVPIGQ